MHTFNFKVSNKKQKHRVVVQAGNNEVIFTSEPNFNRQDLEDTVDNFIAAIKADDYQIVFPDVPE